MNKIVKDIELTFENIDYVVIPNRYFSIFSLQKVETSVSRVAVNAILRYQEAGFVTIKLNKEANSEFENFYTNIDLAHYKGDTLFERIINYNDITSIKLLYEDDSSEEFAVAWEDEKDNECRNKLQIATLDKDGNLCIRIGKA